MASELINYEINNDEVDQKLLEYAKEHINEDPDTTVQKLAEFRDFIYERGECSPTRMDDKYLLRFLRARDFIIRRAHRLMVNYCSYKETNPELYDIKYERLSYIMSLDIITFMPLCDQSNRRMCIFRPGIWNPDIISAQELFQAITFAAEVCIWEPRAQITGTVGIFDLENMGLKQALYLTPSVITKVLHLCAWSYPMRVNKIHVVNESSVFNAGLSFVRPFLSSDIQKYIVLHGIDRSSLHVHIEPKCLPKRYGGIHEDYNNTKWLDVIASSEVLIDEVCKLGYNMENELKHRLG